MKKTTVFLITALIIFPIFRTNGQMVQKGNHMIGIYYGTLPFPKSALRMITYNFKNQQYLGPIGLRYEYMISGKTGLGIDANIQDISEKWTENGFRYGISKNTIRVMPKINYHIIQSTKFDGYLGLGLAGIAYTTWTVNSTEPNYNTETDPKRFHPTMRVAVGSRYFFSKNIGVNLECGYGGGALIHGGLSFKF